jgi:hypothetical protein
VYKLKDFFGDPISGTFYAQELQTFTKQRKIYGKWMKFKRTQNKWRSARVGVMGPVAFQVQQLCEESV